MNKLTSRKFWICVAAFLGSIATSIAGVCKDNQTVATVGIVCGVLSAAIYAFCEAWIDGKAVEKDFDIVIDNKEENDGK
jgi:energy-converting hydrogenase Eha subunit A